MASSNNVHVVLLRVPKPTYDALAAKAKVKEWSVHHYIVSRLEAAVRPKQKEA